MADEPVPSMEQLLATFFRPPSPRLAEARAAVAGIADPVDAWAALAHGGLIPASWVDDPRRRFVQPREVGPWPATLKAGRTTASILEETYVRLVAEDCIPVEGMDLPDYWVQTYLRCGPTPPTVAACVTLASDPAGVARAEALAAEVEARTAPYGCERASRVVWNLAARPWSAFYEREPGRGAERVCVEQGWPDEDCRARDAAVRLADRESEEWVGDALGMDWLRARRWARCRPGEPSPFAPLLAIWRAGYMLDFTYFGWRCLVARELRP